MRHPGAFEYQTTAESSCGDLFQAAGVSQGQRGGDGTTSSAKSDTLHWLSLLYGLDEWLVRRRRVAFGLHACALKARTRTFTCLSASIPSSVPVSTLSALRG